VRLLGVGPTTLIYTKGNPFFDFQGRSFLCEGFVEMGCFSVDAAPGTNAPAHIFQNLNCHGMVKFHDLNLRLRDVNASWFYMDDVAANDGKSTGMYQARFSDIAYWKAPGTRALSPFHAVTTQNEGITDVTFTGINGPRPVGNTGDASGLDNTKHEFYLTCSGSGQGSGLSHLRWRDCDMTSAYGGVIQLGASRGVTIESITHGNSYDAPIVNNLYDFGPDPVSGAPCYGIRLSGCRRGTNLGSQSTHEPPYDVNFDASTIGVIVENYVTDWGNHQGPYINLNGCKCAYICVPSNSQAMPVIANQNTTDSPTIVYGNGYISVGDQNITVP
jgi:hypothetical protein